MRDSPGRWGSRFFLPILHNRCGNRIILLDIHMNSLIATPEDSYENTADFVSQNGRESLPLQAVSNIAMKSIKHEPPFLADNEIIICR
jgi:hypothetical protein